MRSSSTLDRRRTQSLRKQILSGRASVQVVVGAIAIAAIVLALTTFRSGEPSQESKPTAPPARATIVQAAIAAPTSAPIPTPSPSVAPQERVHTVVSGDTLTSIAQKYYGDASKYAKIYEANKDTLPDPNSLKVGQKLKVPE